MQEYKNALKAARQALSETKKTRPDYGRDTMDDPKADAFNNEYLGKQEVVDYLEQKIANLVLIDQSNEKEGCITFGDIVTITYLDTNEVSQVKLSGGINPGSVDTNFYINLLDDGISVITMQSPLGKALYQSKVGDVISIKVGQTQIPIKILSREIAKEKQEASKEQKERTDE